MPGLEEDLAPFLMDCVGHGSPGGGMFLGDHEGGVCPVAARPVNKGALVHDQTRSVPCSVRIVGDMCWARLVVVHTAVPGHGAHDDPVSQGEFTADYDRFQKRRHDELMVVFHEFGECTLLILIPRGLVVLKNNSDQS